MVTQERLKELLEYNPDTGLFTRLMSIGNQKVGNIAGTLRKDGYIQIKVDGKPYLAHQLAFLYMEGYFPEMVDHINRIGGDNRWVNLRESNNQENQRNKAARSKSGYLGVSWKKRDQKWEVNVANSKGSNIYGGHFDYPQLGSAVRRANELRLQLHGENAVIETFDSTKSLPTLEELNK